MQQSPHAFDRIAPAVASWYINKKVLVTGGAGFIGSHLVEALVSYGAQVTIIDDFSTGSDNNIAAVADTVTIIRGSITDPALAALACQGQEIIFHLAAVVSVVESIADPIHCNTINSAGTLTILQAARNAGCNRMIFSSSAAVYGNREGTVAEDAPCLPTSMYGVSKLMGEQYCRLYSMQYGVNTIALRYFNVYGPRQRADSPYSGVIARFTQRLQANQSITIFGDGNQTRDFVPVSIVVQANLIAGTMTEKYQGEAINVGLSKELSINTLLKILQSEFPGYNAPIVHETARSGDIRHSVACNQRLLTLLEQSWLA